MFNCKYVVLLLAIIGLSGCISPGRNVIPSGGPTMGEIYHRTMSEGYLEEIDVIRDEVHDTSEFFVPPLNLEQYTRTARNEINRQFPRLPNPDLVMYVYPHFARLDNAPVPGYSTVFPMYETTHYAMPGEPIDVRP